MSRKDKLFKAFWISMEDRLPPETDEPVLIWNPKILHHSVSIARVVRTQQEQVREKLISKEHLNKPRMTSTGYFATHWTKIYAPGES